MTLQAHKGLEKIVRISKPSDAYNSVDINVSSTIVLSCLLQVVYLALTSMVFILLITNGHVTLSWR